MEQKNGNVNKEWFKHHNNNTIPTIQMPKNGYIYVYCSNESQYNVFFDNLQLIHTRGPLVEETHYYPFGLTMAGIGSKALAFGSPQNRYKYNGGNELQSGEFNDGSGLEMFDAVNRMYDQQIGRFWQIDELAEASWEESPYHFAHNNPILFNDPLGLDPETSTPDKPKELQGVTIISVPKGLWAQRNLYYQISDLLKARGATADQLVQPTLRDLVNHYDRQFEFKKRVNEMTRESDKAFLEAASWFIPVGWIAKLRYVRYAANLFRFKRGVSSYKLWLALSKAERGIVKEAGAILNSPQMVTLKTAFEKGISAEVKVGGRTVIYNPEMAASGFTLHGEGFLLGREAFASSQELGKTVLHELYRLGTQGTGELAVDLTRTYTNAAFEFAEKAINLFRF